MIDLNDLFETEADILEEEQELLSDLEKEKLKKLFSLLTVDINVKETKTGFILEPLTKCLCGQEMHGAYLMLHMLQTPDKQSKNVKKRTGHGNKFKTINDCLNTLISDDLEPLWKKK